MEELKLAFLKPLVFIKVQTTGLNPKTDKIIELSLTKVGLDGKTIKGTRLVNPEMQIPEDTTRVNGITNDMVKGKQTFKEIAENINKFLDGSDFAGFNINNFDLKFLSEEFYRAGIEFTLLGRKVVDLSDIYYSMEPRDLSAASVFFCGKKLEGNLNAQKTTDLYFDLLNSMMDKYSGKDFSDKDGKVKKIEATVDSLNDLFNKNKKRLDISGFIVLNSENRPVFAEGKYKGKIVSDTILKDEDGLSYYDWIVNASNFSPDTKLVIKKIYEKAKAAKDAAKIAVPATK